MNLQEDEKCGDSSGEFLGTRYFTAAPNSSIFTTIDHLAPYINQSAQHSKITHYNENTGKNKSTYFPRSYCNAVSGHKMFPNSSFSENKTEKTSTPHFNSNFINERNKRDNKTVTSTFDDHEDKGK